MNPFDGLPLVEDVLLIAERWADGEPLAETYLRQFAAILPYIEQAKEKGTPMTTAISIDNNTDFHAGVDESVLHDRMLTHSKSLELAISAVRAATVEECAKVLDEVIAELRFALDPSYSSANARYKATEHKLILEDAKDRIRALLTTKPPAPDKADDELRRLGYPL